MTTYRFIREVTKDALYTPGYQIPERVEITAEGGDLTLEEVTEFFRRFVNALGFEADNICTYNEEDIEAIRKEFEEQYRAHT